MPAELGEEFMEGLVEGIAMVGKIGDGGGQFDAMATGVEADGFILCFQKRQLAPVLRKFHINFVTQSLVGHSLARDTTESPLRKGR